MFHYSEPPPSLVYNYCETVITLKSWKNRSGKRIEEINGGELKDSGDRQTWL